ncbi:TPA: hypothetical protein EYP38_05170 [Candidatus Micrarchaeota archaeon]|nr:hypothetical protein [Candidatus Micrarchaeota archaeon]
MRTTLVLLLSMILLFGCVSEPAAVPSGTGTEAPPEGEAPPAGEQPPGEMECDASYAFSQLQSVKLSEVTTFTITATCSEGKEIGLYLNDKLAGKLEVLSNDPTVLNFDIVATVDGVSDVVVKSNDETIYAEEWNIAPLGSTDVSGSDFDQISNKKWLAVAFEVENRVKVGSIGAYVKRLNAQTLQESYVLAEIRGSEGGNPGESIIASSMVPITETTLTDNWLYLNYDVTLQPGKYWIVFRVAKDEPTIVGDVITLHYVSVDTHAPPNDYTRRMTLEWSDTERVWEQTSWEELPFDKEYAVVISANER